MMELFIGVFQQRMDILKISREKFPYSSNYVVSGLHHEYVPVINDFLANWWKRFLGVSCSPGRGIWGGMERSSEARRGKESLISTFACFLTVVAGV